MFILTAERAIMSKGGIRTELQLKLEEVVVLIRIVALAWASSCENQPNDESHAPSDGN